MSFQILGTGSFAPEKIVTNDDLSHMVETSDEWITKRVGVKQRHVCTTETATDMGVAAARRALENSGVKPEELDMIIAATISADTISPGLAGMVQNRLGATCPCFDMNVACPGFLFALDVADGFFARGRVKKVLVVSSERMSGLIDWADRSTCVIFGDGAGAVVVKLEEAPYAYTLGAEGGDDGLYIGGCGSQEPYIHMEGQKTFRFAVEKVPQCVHRLLEESGLSLEDIDWFVLHQANKRIIDHVAKKLGVPGERFYQNISQYGNTSAASIPIALDEMAEQGLLQRGQKLLLVGFGAGLTWGGALLEW